MADVPAVMIVGPRAAGKSTTAARFASTVVQLDRAGEAAAFRADPDAALAALPAPILLDEWQEVPGVLAAVKRAVDADRSPGRYLLAGSVRADLQAAAWPGTGRVIRLRMYPLTVAEQMGRAPGPLVDRLLAGEPLAPAPDPPDLRGYIDLALVGGFPEAALGVPERTRRLWLESYIEQILTHDAPTGNGGRERDPQRLSRYLMAYAVNSAGVAADRTIYTAAGINGRTALAYEGLLGDLMVAASLPAWTTNRLKRLTKSPKRHLVDTGLWAAVMGVDAMAPIRDGDLLGRLLDTFVTAQLRAEATVATNSHRSSTSAPSRAARRSTSSPRSAHTGSPASRSRPLPHRPPTMPGTWCGCATDWATASPAAWSSTPVRPCTRSPCASPPLPSARSGAETGTADVAGWSGQPLAARPTA